MAISNITATHLNYFQICKRKLWLFSNGIRMEHTSDVVAEGKLIGENTYLDRSQKYTELEFDGVKIDFYDARNKVVHEVKKSDKVENAHIAQVKYYLYKLLKNGVEGATGIIEYPKLRQRADVLLKDGDIEEIEQNIEKINILIASEHCPPVINAKTCKICSYFDFCYIDEGV